MSRVRAANKGVLITTSTFTSSALKYAEQVPHKIILIDGEKLANLMMDFGVGVVNVETFVHQRLDENYFSEE